MTNVGVLFQSRGFSTSESSADIQADHSLSWGLFCALRMVSSIPGLSLLDADSTTSGPSASAHCDLRRAATRSQKAAAQVEYPCSKETQFGKEMPRGVS